MPTRLSHAALASSLLLLLTACGQSPEPVSAPSHPLSALALTSGAFDPTFGTNGQVTVSGEQHGVATLPDGTLLVVGTEGGDFTLTRVAPGGSLQRSRIDLGGNDAATGVFVQDNGKVLLTGMSGNRFALVRLKRDLRPDPSLGKDGKLVTDLTAKMNVSAATVQGDGKILVGGGVWKPGGIGTDYALARFLPNGRRDPGFGEGGLVVTPAEPPFYGDASTGRITALTVQEDGQIVAGTEYLVTGMYGPTARLVRYRTDGTLDTTYGRNGQVELWSAGRFYARITDLALQADGQVVAVGGAWLNSCLIGRVSRDGHSAQTVDLSPSRLVNWSASPVSVALQGDGKLLMAGCAWNTGGEYSYDPSAPPTVARLKTDLTLDRAFGKEGVVIVPDAEQVLVQPDGKIVVGLNTLTRLQP